MRFIFLLLLLDLFDHLVLRFAVRFSFSLSFDYSLCKKWLSFIFSTLCFVLFFLCFVPISVFGLASSFCREPSQD